MALRTTNLPYLTIGIMLLHYAALNLYFPDTIPAIYSLLWMAGKNGQDIYLEFPFGISRLYDPLIWPVLFYCISFAGVSSWWKKWAIGSVHFAHTVNIVVGVVIVLSGLLAGIDFDYAGLFFVLLVFSALIFSIIVLGADSEKFWTAVYNVCVMWFTSGVLFGVFRGGASFAVVGLVPGLIAFLIVALKSGNFGQAYFGFVKKSADKAGVWFETKYQLINARNLKVTRATKEKVLVAVKEIPVLRADIAKLRVRSDTFSEGIAGIEEQLEKNRKFASKKNVAHIIEEAQERAKENIQNLSEQLETLKKYRDDISNEISEKGKLLDVHLAVIEQAKKEARDCEQHDLLQEGNFQLEKNIAKLMKKTSADVVPPK